MGIDLNLMIALIRDGKRKPYAGKAYTLGRQSMATSPEGSLKLFDRLGASPAVADLSEIAVDEATSSARQNPEFKRIRDVDFFRMLGFAETSAIDIDAFEGAEIILDINAAIPADFEGSADLIVDGSVLDNIFDPVTALKNVARMLKSGGRCFLLNAATINVPGIPYTLLSPIWFFDYFVWNDFDYCQVYVSQYGAPGHGDKVYAISYEHASRHRGDGLIRWIPSPAAGGPMAVTIFAEKGTRSTWDRAPTQSVYRNDDDWKRYTAIVDRYRVQERPHLFRSSNTDGDEAIPPGYLRVLPDGQSIVA